MKLVFNDFRPTFTVSSNEPILSTCSKGSDCEAPIVGVIGRTKALLAQLSTNHNCAAPIFLFEWNNALRWTHLWLILAGALAETLG